MAGWHPTLIGSSGRAIGCRPAAHFVAGIVSERLRIRPLVFPRWPAVVTSGISVSLLQRPPRVSRRVIPGVMGLRGPFFGSPEHGGNTGFGPKVDQSHSLFPDTPARGCLNGSGAGPLLHEGGAGPRAYQKGEQALVHGVFTFALRRPVVQPVDPLIFLKGPALEDHPLQGELPLLCRVDAPSVVPTEIVRTCRTYRDAVRLCWRLRRVRNLTLTLLACEAGLTAQHISDYLHHDDNPRRRDLPADRVSAFERVLGNTAVSQWLAAQSQLTVLEEMTASRRVA